VYKTGGSVQYNFICVERLLQNSTKNRFDKLKYQNKHSQFRVHFYVTEMVDWN